MSLGSFFRDYVYIPMGGNRRHQPLNIFVVWFLTGMWHGASWNFIIWGLYFGVIVTLEKYTLLKVQRYVPDVLLHIYSLLLVLIGWGIFYFDDFTQMTHFFSAFFGQCREFTNFISLSALTDHLGLWVLALLFCMPMRRWITRLLTLRANPEGWYYNAVVFSGRLVVSITLLVLSVALLVGATNNAFIYTRF